MRTFLEGLEGADLEKSCSNAEAHILVLRNIAEKLSADALAEDSSLPP